MSKSLTNVPVSQILKNKSLFEDEPKKKSREDWKKAKELEDARKAGTAPAAVDEEGRDINPHIPQYISQAPWYFGAEGPTLKHQRYEEETQSTLSNSADVFKRGLKSAPSAKRWRKGACENCGATTHKKKDCMERPRKIGAKFTNSKIAPDEYLQTETELDYDGKRDRWAGYDVSEHRTIVEEYQKIEEAKKQLRAEKLQNGNKEDDEKEEEEANSEDDEDKYADGVDMPGTKVDSKQRITVRNLRIREDTAKYLRNLALESAYYDPKSRAMRGNPYAGTEREVDYEGDNLVRISGDTEQHQRAQLFAWEAQKRQVDVHLLAEPTKLEMLKKTYDENKDQLEDKKKDDLIERYGGAEHLGIPESIKMLSQTQGYREYSRSGEIIKGDEKPIIRSKYEEDVHPNNHTSVFGSFWRNGNWGYKCCYSFVKNSYCTGEAGKQAIEEAAKINYEEHERKVVEEKPKTKSKKSKKRKEKEGLDEDRLKEALKNEEEHRKQVEQLMQLDERKRPYNNVCNVDKPTDEQIEAYHIKRIREDDPMANFL